jgi:heme A synthase
MYDPTIRTVVEIVSAILCFILIRFMIKPYKLTGEGRYLGLPLGFGFLGVSYILGAIAFSQTFFPYRELAYIQLFSRTFAYCFLVVTYYFSKKPSKNSRIKWDITLSLLIVALTASIVIAIIIPQFAVDSYQAAQVYVRIFNIICLIYISIHTLRSHINKPDRTTILIPFGFILLGISQYSLLIWAIDESIFAFNGALVLRLTALAIFLFVSYLTFYYSSRRTSK